MKLEIISKYSVDNTQPEILPEMAHDMMLEPRWQAVAKRILVWLKELDFIPT